MADFELDFVGPGTRLALAAAKRAEAAAAGAGDDAAAIVAPLVEQAQAAELGVQTVYGALAVAGLIANFTNPGFIVPVSGVVDATTNAGQWFCTGFIDLDLVEPAQLKLKGDPAVLSVAYYTRGRAFVSGVAAASAGGFVTAYARPATARYARFSARVGFADQVFVLADKPTKLPDSRLDAGRVGYGNLFTLMRNRGYLTSGSPPAVNQDQNWQYSDPIAVTPGYQVDYDLYGASTVSAIAYFDASDVFMPASRVLGTGSGAQLTGSSIVPAGAATMRICGGNPDTLGAAAATPNLVKYGPPTSAVAAMPAGEVAIGNLSYYLTTVGYIRSDNGVAVTAANWLRSGYIPVRKGRYVAVDAVGTGSMNLVSFYSAANEASFVSGLAGVSNNTRSTTAIQVPVDGYMRISQANIEQTGGAFGWTKDSFVSTFRYLANLPSLALPIVPSTALCGLYGTSIMSTDYPVARAVWAARMGCAVTQFGKSGHTAQQLASDADLADLFASVTVPRVIPLLLGGNDTGAAGSVGTFSAASINGVGGEVPVAPLALATATPTGTRFIQAVDLVVQKMLAQYQNIRARAALTGSETEVQKNDKIRALVKPILVLITDPPQQRSTDPAWGLPANHERKRQAVLEVAAFRKIRCVDFYGRFPVDMSFEPLYGPPTDKVTNNGVWTFDGLHPNEFMHDEMACMTKGDMGLAS